MIYFISDLHLGHENVISLCKRPFASIEEMNERLICEWNKVVHRNDKVYILGDIIFKSASAPEYYLERLKGEKHLIIGNHDRTWIDKVDLQKYFKSVETMSIINTGKGKATLCHFPMLAYEGRYMIHGHIHAKASKLEYWEVIKNNHCMLNAGVDINGFKPVSLEELIENNARFKTEH